MDVDPEYKTKKSGSDKKNKKHVCCLPSSFKSYKIIFFGIQLSMVPCFIISAVISIWAFIQALDSKFENTTIYTQATDDWNNATWVDFILSDSKCPKGYEAIGSLWGGTFNGNYTSSRQQMVVVSPDNSEYGHQIDQILPVF